MEEDFNIAQNKEINCNIPVNDKHPNIEKIKENMNMTTFEFKPVTVTQVSKCVKRLYTKKATGVDAIHSKIIKAAAPVISRHVANLTNEIQTKEAFPTHLSKTQVSPIFKKDDPLHRKRKKYRPFSILPTLSKIYERLLSEQ